MRRCFGYIRVSTTRQGKEGASLPEQKAQIEAYAARMGYIIVRWYEEQETAAKIGRKQFALMLRAIRRGEAEGIIFHKVDRSMRNYVDWAAINRLLDEGVLVHIAAESLDLNSRSGRLTANILAAVAVDYIYNLKDEVTKGQTGRLKQGLYPWGAPPGYLNNGGTELKTIDPIRGALIRRAYEEYAAEMHSLRTLQEATYAWGLRTKSGKRLSLNVLNQMLRRKFYIGIIEIRGETYIGRHEPLIPKPLFDRVQAVLDGRTGPRIYQRSPYVFQRMLMCKRCGRHLAAETQKGHAYYRCHGEDCRGTSLREAAILDCLYNDIAAMKLSDETCAGVVEALKQKKHDTWRDHVEMKKTLKLHLDQVNDRLKRLDDAYLDGVLDKDAVQARKAALHNERLNLDQALTNKEGAAEQFDARAAEFVELLKSLQGLAKQAEGHELRKVLKSAISNCTVQQKYVAVEWRKSVRPLLAREPVLSCAHDRDSHRTTPTGITSTSPLVVSDSATGLERDSKTVYEQVADAIYDEALEEVILGRTIPPLGSNLSRRYGEVHDHAQEARKATEEGDAHCVDTVA
jgi:site-specific DNA recombinase